MTERVCVYCAARSGSLYIIQRKVKVVPLDAKQAPRRGEGLPVRTLDPSARSGWVVNSTPQPAHPLERDAISIK